MHSILKRIAESTTVDIRGDVSFEQSESSTQSVDYATDYDLNMYLNGEKIGYMVFRESRYRTGKPEELKIRNVEIDEKFRNFGFGQLLYKEFGNIYVRDYNGLPVIRLFQNPIAEYAYKKALSLGWISDLSYSEDNIERWYKSENEQLYTDLRNKLPDKFKGPEWNEI